ncbi:DNA repair protein RecO [bacterium]|nr:DNA repair protein RecO [bacterium]
MPKLLKSEALILRRFRQGDTSLVLHAFTREAGRIPFIAKGARAGGKKPPVPLVPVVLLELIWAPSTKSELQLLREWSLVDGFGALHGDFDRLAWAQAALETLGRTLTGEEAHASLFDMTLDYLRALGGTKGRYENLFHRFRLRTLQELGYELNLELPKNATGVGRFRPLDGALHFDHHQDGIPVNLGAWKSLAILNRGGWDETVRLKLNPSISNEIGQILDVAYRHAFDRWKPLASLRLLEPADSFSGSKPAPAGGPQEVAGQIENEEQ